MHRLCLIWITCWLFASSMLANDSLPVIEVKADRTMIYPQRMDLTGEESLLDVLQMMPELMVSGHHHPLPQSHLTARFPDNLQCHFDLASGRNI